MIRRLIALSLCLGLSFFSPLISFCDDATITLLQSIDNRLKKIYNTNDNGIYSILLDYYSKFYNLPQCYQDVADIETILNALQNGYYTNALSAIQDIQDILSDNFLIDIVNYLEPIFSTLNGNYNCLMEICSLNNTISEYLSNFDNGDNTWRVTFGDMDGLEDAVYNGFQGVLDNGPIDVNLSNVDALDSLFDTYFGGIEAFLSGWSPSVNVSVGDVDLDFDYSRWDNVFDIAQNLKDSTFDDTMRYIHWSSMPNENTKPTDATEVVYSESTDWFSAVHSQLRCLINNADNNGKTQLAILFQLCKADDDAEDLKEETESRISSLSSQCDSLSSYPLASYIQFSVPSILQSPAPISQSDFVASCPSVILFDMSQFTPDGFSSSNFQYIYRVNLLPYQTFFSSVRSVALCIYWFICFVLAFFAFSFIFRKCASASFYFLKLTGSL